MKMSIHFCDYKELNPTPGVCDYGCGGVGVLGTISTDSSVSNIETVDEGGSACLM